MPFKKYKWGERDAEVEGYVNKTFRKFLWFNCIYPRVDGLYYYLTIFQVFFWSFGNGFFTLTMAISIAYSMDNMIFAMRFLRLGSLSLAIDICMLCMLFERGRLTEMIRLHIDKFFDYEEDNIVGELEIIEKEKKSRVKYLLVIPIYDVYTGITMMVVPFYFFQDVKFPEVFDTKSILPAWTPDPQSIWFNLLYQVSLFAFTFHLVLVITGGVHLLVHLFESLVGQIQFLVVSVRKLDERVKAHFKKMRKIDNAWTMDNSFNHCFKQNVQHHLLLFEYKRAMEKYISYALLSLLFISTTILGANAFLLVIQRDKISLILAISGVIADAFIIFCYNLYGQMIIDESERLRFALYDMNWFNFNVPQKKMIVFMQIITAKPLRVSLAGGLLGLDIESFREVVKATYSLFNFLIAVN